MAARGDPDELVDPLEGAIGYEFRRAAAATILALEAALAPLGLRPVEAVILRFVDANPGCNQAAISRALGVTRTNMVPFVGRLVGEGLIERQASDGRTHALFLTGRGRDLCGRLARIAQAQDERFFGAFDEATRRMLAQAFRRMRDEAAANPQA
jgi:DNA-binding MarR family transcriptional regulator